VETREDVVGYSRRYVTTVGEVLKDPSYEVIARPVFIKESLKVRPVTTGPSVGYHTMMPLQKFLFRTLRRFPTFELIGTRVSSDILQKLLDLDVVKLNPEWSWLSGDYTAATDNLRKCLSDHCLLEIGRVTNIPPDYLALAKKCLTGHTLDYTKVKKHLPAESSVMIEQGNGQLMGSPLSFPILCLINAALCKLAFEDNWCPDGDWSECREFRLRDLPILINGDDCVMFFSPEMKEGWYKVTAHAGLVPSVGKCYWAPSWLQINSELFYLQDGKFHQTYFLNFGLTVDFSNKGGEPRTWMDLEPLHSAFIKGFSPEKQIKLSEIFRRCQKDLIARAPEGICWSLPQSLGGLGVAIPDATISPCKRALQLATHIMSETISRRRPVVPFRREDLSIPAFVREGLRDASKHSVVVDCPTLESLFRKRSVELEFLESESPLKVFKQLNPGSEDPEEDECLYGKKLAPISYNPWLWKSLIDYYTDTDGTYDLDHGLLNENLEESHGHHTPEWLKASRKASKSWTKMWNLAGTVTPFPLETIRSWVPPTSVIPGGLSDAFAKSYCPRGLIDGVCTVQGCAVRPDEPLPAPKEPTTTWISHRADKLMTILIEPMMELSSVKGGWPSPDLRIGCVLFVGED
jgi:hypothetical protein